MQGGLGGGGVDSEYGSELSGLQAWSAFSYGRRQNGKTGYPGDGGSGSPDVNFIRLYHKRRQKAFSGETGKSSSRGGARGICG